MENLITLTAESRASLEKKVSNQFAKDYRPITDVVETENGEFQIVLKR